MREHNDIFYFAFARDLMYPSLSLDHIINDALGYFLLTYNPSEKNKDISAYILFKLTLIFPTTAALNQADLQYPFAACQQLVCSTIFSTYFKIWVC
jgi:hypothetical protein